MGVEICVAPLACVYNNSAFECHGAPTFPPTPLTFTVPENSTQSTVIGTVVALASTAANVTGVSVVRYRFECGAGLVHCDMATFVVDEATGEVSVELPLDFETISAYQLQVNADMFTYYFMLLYVSRVYVFGEI